MKKKIILTVIAVVLAAAGVFGISYAAAMTLIQQKNRENQEETVTDPKTDKPDSTAETELPAATDPVETIPEPEPVEIPVDFTELKKTNPDIYAWITIPDTPIDFPVLQNADDNNLYLRHNYLKEYNINGSIYTENYNSTDFSDYMTVVYGHTMKTGVMFTPLLQYMDNVFFDEHRTITIYTPDARRIYTVFAAYEYDTRHLLLNIDFSNERVRGVYLDYVTNIRSMNTRIADDLTVTTSDKILTLSCCNLDGSARFLVQAVLTEEAFVS